MFTGLIEEIGTVAAVQKSAASGRLSVKGSVIFDDMKPGDSVAVNGVCLTVTKFGGGLFTADVMHETFSRSNLGSLRPGSKVNLERAMLSGGRFGGHIVSGHIDGVGRIVRTEYDGDAVWVTVSADKRILKYIVEKGSVAIDGISLTVARASRDSFAVSVIPHTGKATTLSGRRAGDAVNLENDIVGKYIARFSCFQKAEGKPGSNITAEFLASHGF